MGVVNNKVFCINRKHHYVNNKAVNRKNSKVNKLFSIINTLSRKNYYILSVDNVLLKNKCFMGRSK